MKKPEHKKEGAVAPEGSGIIPRKGKATHIKEKIQKKVSAALSPKSRTQVSQESDQVPQPLLKQLSVFGMPTSEFENIALLQPGECATIIRQYIGVYTEIELGTEVFLHRQLGTRLIRARVTAINELQSPVDAREFAKPTAIARNIPYKEFVLTILSQAV